MAANTAHPTRDTFDVIIVGAGPAGATAAYFLATGSDRGQGKRVALLDKASFPRDKFCGDAWCEPALNLLEEMGVLQQLESEGLTRDCTSGGFVSPSGESYANAPDETTEGVVGTRCFAIKRVICDERIARRAAEVGATLFENANFQKAELEADGLWTLRCADGRIFRGRMLIAADGATSQVARSLGIVSTPPEGVASRRYVKAGTHNFKSGGVLLYPSYILPGYVALFRHYDDEVDLGAYVIPGGAAKPEDLMHLYETKVMRDPFIQRVLGPRVEFSERLRVASLRTGGVPQSTSTQFMAVGDAAGQTDPLTGEGIHTGMIGGKLAAQTIHELFERRNFSAQACAVYHERWMKAFGRDFPLSATSARFTHRFPFLLDAANVVAQRKGAGFMGEFGAAMTGVKPKSTFLKPGVSIPLTIELARQVFLQKVLHRGVSVEDAYDRHAREQNSRTTAFQNSCLIDSRIEARGDSEQTEAGDAVEATLREAFQYASDDPSARRVCVFYGTEYGFAREVASRVCERLREPHENSSTLLSPVYLSLEQHELIHPESTACCLFICSTAGDGIPPIAAKPFFEELQAGEHEIADVCTSVLALGDSSYPNFCRAGKTLESLLEKRGGRILVPLVEVDKEDLRAVDSWTEAVRAVLTDPEFWKNSPQQPSNAELRERLQLLLGASAHRAGLASREAPYFATLVERHLLTEQVEAGDKETLHIELDVSKREEGLAFPEFAPGDALGVLASNAPEEVQGVLDALARSGKEEIELPRGKRRIPLREVLTKRLDIKSVPQPILDLLLEHCPSPVEREQLVKLASEDARTYLEPRELLDVLRDFPSTTRKLDSQSLANQLRPLQARYYSIASSPLVDSNRVALTVEVVRYEALGRARTGLATTFLADRVADGDGLPVFLQPNPEFRLPAPEEAKSCIMIGAGTGIAPFRAFFQEIETRTQHGDCPEPERPHLLFFGCRRQARDFLYASEWEDWERKGLIHVFPAFSRDQAEKIYVQHRMKEHGAMLWERICAGDPFYICGDASKMAVAVEQALFEILRIHGRRSEDEARAQLDEMRTSGQLQKDVWNS